MISECSSNICNDLNVKLCDSLLGYVVMNFIQYAVSYLSQAWQFTSLEIAIGPEIADVAFAFGNTRLCGALPIKVAMQRSSTYMRLSIGSGRSLDTLEDNIRSKQYIGDVILESQVANTFHDLRVVFQVVHFIDYIVQILALRRYSVVHIYCTHTVGNVDKSVIFTLGYGRVSLQLLCSDIHIDRWNSEVQDIFLCKV